MSSPDPTCGHSGRTRLRVSVDAPPDPGQLLRFDFARSSPPAGARDFRVDMTRLAGPEVEAWTAGAPGEPLSGTDGLRGVRTDDLLFVELRADADQDPRQAAERVYRRLFETIDSLGFEHILKAWNHLPAINKGPGDLENYKRFCLGRAQAIDACYANRTMPAGTGVGFSGDGALQVQALAVRDAPLYIENPRQISAFEYPRQYGPRSPSFSRAVVLESDRPLLFVSGTAAIVGHQSRHADCLESQIAETLHNWESLFRACEAATGKRPTLSHDGTWRVYLRHAGHLERCVAALQRHELPLDRTVILRADICRPELLFELDGVVALDP